MSSRCGFSPCSVLARKGTADFGSKADNSTLLHLLVFFSHFFFGDRMRSSIKKFWHSATALLQSSAIPFSFLLFPDILGGRARALKKPARAKPFEPRATRRACPRSLVLSSHCRHLMSDAPFDNSSVPVSLRSALY